MFEVNNSIIFPQATNRFIAFQDLMRHRVQNILLVSSIYDSFILSEDGELSELMLSEYLDLNLRHAPGITHVSSGEKALQIAKSDPRFNLIITTLHLGDMDALEFAGKVKEAKLDIPVILLTYNIRELKELEKLDYSHFIDKVFLWHGDFQILLAIVKYMEDKLNVENDTKTVGVQVIILIEDNVRFYSSYLPTIYTELMKQSQSLISEGLNTAHKLLRMRARPKILLSTNFEEAWDYYRKYEEFILGIISDVEFPQAGEIDNEAGANFVRQVKERRDDIPILLQSSKPANAELAQELQVSFVLKNSPMLLNDVRRFMLDNFGFGDFVFNLPDGTEVGRAKDLRRLERALHTIPAESIRYHGERDHFSNWLKARTEFYLAEKLKPQKVSDYATLDDLRQYLISTLNEFQHERQQGVIVDFDRESFDTTDGFARIGGGSLGGKARGLAFVRTMINNYELGNYFDGVRIFVPPTVVLGTEVFDQFMEMNELWDFAMVVADDEIILEKFLQAEFPPEIVSELDTLLQLAKYPLAVRSSSLLEDSQYQPFAGVYETYMLPNCHPDSAARLNKLLGAVKRVYASTYSRRAKAYFRSTPYRLEEEKMAVVIQKLVGSQYENRFYPTFSGVAKSHNYYSTPPMKSTDGVVIAALGLGKTVVEGGIALNFSPKYPRNLIQFASTEDFLKSSQKQFYALQMRGIENHIDEESEIIPAQFSLDFAERDGTLQPVGSVYSYENKAVYDGLSRQGVRLVSFAPILKHKVFPLPEVIQLLLQIGYIGMNAPIEIEFGVNLNTPPKTPKEFSLLQMRPLVVSTQIEDLKIEDYSKEEMICSSTRVLGNGVISGIKNIVVIDIDRFKRSDSISVAREVGSFNSQLVAENEPYLLIGVGRWGSADPWLGIPVDWEQISGAKVIVESGFADFKVVPSQGSHFFQNITSMMIGYFTVNPHAGDGFIDWDWLRGCPAAQEKKYTRLIRLEKPITAKMNGFKNMGVILKP